jgi:flagellar basal body-associated protein FliL
MKKIAFFILILFTVVQILPTVQSIWGNGQAIVLDISEEKKTDKDDKKSTKEFISYFNISQNLTVNLLTQIHLAESIMPSPCFEKHTPPPDFC